MTTWTLSVTCELPFIIVKEIVRAYRNEWHCGEKAEALYALSRL